MSVVHQLFAVTNELYEVVSKPVEVDNRDLVISDIERLLNERETVMRKLSGSYTEEEKEIGKQIVTLNKVITVKLASFKSDIQKAMNRLKQTKSTSQKYANPYQNLTIDGMFYDKRK